MESNNMKIGKAEYTDCGVPVITKKEFDKYQATKKKSINICDINVVCLDSGLVRNQVIEIRRNYKKYCDNWSEQAIEFSETWPENIKH